MSRPTLDAHGTPMPPKTPINFQARKDELTRANQDAMKKLCTATFVSTFFIIAQLIGGYMANSIAIFTDSAHLASDIVGFGISIFSLRMATTPATKSLSFGYHRSEIIGTLVSLVLIWGLTIWLVYEATLRIFTPQPIAKGIMMFVAVMGLCFNLIQIRILHSGDDHDHDHGHGHGHDHGHSHGHSHGPSKDQKITDKASKKASKDLKEGLINKDDETEDNENGAEEQVAPLHRE